jgi:hypothetical protein
MQCLRLQCFSVFCFDLTGIVLCVLYSCVGREDGCFIASGLQSLAIDRRVLPREASCLRLWLKPAVSYVHEVQYFAEWLRLIFGPLVEQIFAYPMVDLPQYSMPRRHLLSLSEELRERAQKLKRSMKITHVKSHFHPLPSALDDCQVIPYAPPTKAFIDHDR